MAASIGRRILLVSGLGLVALGGCAEDEAPSTVAAPVPVTVARPLERMVAPYAVFHGQLDAVESVEVRARVSGYLDKIDFYDGAKVTKGLLLFEIDPRPYDAALAKATAEVARWQAQLQRATADLARAEKLRPSGTITQEEYDQAFADRGVAAASLQAAQADLVSAQLNLEYTKITAPITGRASRAEITVGNLVTADSTLLTTIVSDDPIRGYADVDEHTVLYIREQIRQGKLKSARESGDVKVWMQLADETGFPHEGVIDFVDNRIDPTTGTIRVRAVFPNPDGAMSPGFFFRVKVLLSNEAPALLVSERALVSELGEKFLMVVNDKNEAERRAVRVGMLDGNLRVIESGIGPDDLVIVVGQQRVREGRQVSTKLIEMPGAAASEKDAKPATTPAAPPQTPAAPQATTAPPQAPPAAPPGVPQ